MLFSILSTIGLGSLFYVVICKINISPTSKSHIFTLLQANCISNKPCVFSHMINLLQLA